MSPPFTVRASWREIALYLALVLLPWPLLYPALGFEFASDDRIMIVENRHMRDPGNWWRMLSTDAFDRTIEGFDYEVASPVGHWRPINKLSYLIDYTLWGPDSTFFHLSGILVHLASGCLLAWLGRLLGLSRLGALLSASLFLLHPVAARPLGLVSLRADLWCGFFSLLSVALVVRGEGTAGRARKILLGASLLSAFLGLAGKETALFLPLFFAAYFFVRRRSAVAAARATAPYLAVVGLYAFLRFAVFDIATGEQNIFPAMGAWTLFMSLSRLAFSYLLSVAAPLLVDRLWLPEILRGFPPFTVWLSWAFLLALGAALYLAWRRRAERALLGALLVLLPVLPLLNIWAISGEDVGELLPFEAHRLYIPVMGLALLWGLAFEAAGSRVRRVPWLALLAVYPLLFPGELSVYRNTESIVRRKLSAIEGFAPERLPASLQVLRLNQQAIELKRQGRYAEAEKTLLEILALKPYDAIALKNLGVVALLQKEPDRAIGYLQTVLNPVPQQTPEGEVRLVIDDPQLRHTGEVQKVLGQAYQMKGEHERAREHLQLAARIDPTDYEVALLLAWNAVLRGDDEAAQTHLRRFLQEAPADEPRRGFAAAKLRELAGEEGE